MKQTFTSRKNHRKTHIMQLPEEWRRVIACAIFYRNSYREILMFPALQKALEERNLTLSSATLSHFRHSREYRRFRQEFEEK